MAATHDLLVDEGATFRRVVRWLQSDGVTPVPLDGYTGRLEARERGATTPALLLTDSDGIAIRRDVGEVEFTIADELTTGLPTGLRYVLEVTSPAGDVWRLLKGKVKVDKRFT